MPIMPAQISESVTLTENGTYNIARYTIASVEVTPESQELVVTPTTSVQIINTSAGISGYGPVKVKAVTATIDANIQPENIKKDVTILGVTGTHEGGGGITPTGTKDITGNGSYDVTNYAAASVNVPTTAPNTFIEFKQNSSEGLKRGGHFMNFHGVTKIGYMGCTGAYQNAGISNIQYPSIKMEGGVDLSTIQAIEISGFANTFRSSGLTGDVAFDSLQKVDKSGALSHCFEQSSISSFSANITHVAASHSMEYLCKDCYNLETVSFPNLSFIWYENAISYGFVNCTKLKTVSFPNLGSLGTTDNFSNLYNNCCEYLFSGCTALTDVDLSNLKALGGCQGYIFQNCTSLTSIDLGSLECIYSSGTNYNTTGAAGMMFSGCTSLTNVNLKSLASIRGYSSAAYVNCGPAMGMFSGCTSLVSQKFESLNEVAGNYYMANMFNNCTSLSSVWFYALTPSSFGSSNTQFYQMLTGCSNVTVHFPKAIQSTIENWSVVTNGFSGTGTTVEFDIITELTGADGNTYIRQEKDSTNTATAWSYNDSLYYTSGTAEPTVDMVIYSDDDCLTTVTTIAAIA